MHFFSIRRLLGASFVVTYFLENSRDNWGSTDQLDRYSACFSVLRTTKKIQSMLHILMDMTRVYEEMKIHTMISLNIRSTTLTSYRAVEVVRVIVLFHHLPLHYEWWCSRWGVRGIILLYCCLNKRIKFLWRGGTEHASSRGAAWCPHALVYSCPFVVSILRGERTTQRGAAAYFLW